MEGRLENIFDMQDRIASQVAAAIIPALRSVEIARAQHKPTENLSAYDLYLRALPRYLGSLAENREALRLLHKAIEIDPSYSTAYAFAAHCYHVQKMFGWVPPVDPQLNEGIRLARLAAKMGKSDSEALWMAGFGLALLAGEVEHGLVLIERSVSLNPNSSNALLACSYLRVFLGDSDGALEDVSRAMRLNPLDSMHFAHWHAASMAHLCAGRFEQAADAADKVLNEWPSNAPALRMKVVTSGLLGRIDEARDYVRRLLAVHPDASVGWLRAFWETPMRGNPRTLAKLLEGARLAGLPEGNEHLNPTG
jgi:tetratricopeptide (TPR) repeat protein